MDVMLNILNQERFAKAKTQILKINVYNLDVST